MQTNVPSLERILRDVKVDTHAIPATELPELTMYTNDIHSREMTRFRLSNVHVSIANGIRRTILSDIPTTVCRVSPHNMSKCVVYANSSGLNNEIVKHRLSCIPVHLDYQVASKYMVEVLAKNQSNTLQYVTTEDFVVKEVSTNHPLSKEEIRRIFPADANGNFIDFVRLKARHSEDMVARQIHLTCVFDVGTAKEDSVFNVVHTCTYGNTIDEAAQAEALGKMRQKWADEGKNEAEIEFETANWKLLEGKRIIKKDSFEFILETVGVYENMEIFKFACYVMMQRLEAIGRGKNVEIKSADCTIPNSFDIKLLDQDHTIGKILEHVYYVTYEMSTKEGMFVSFDMLHPHDSHGVLRVSYDKPMEASEVQNELSKMASIAYLKCAAVFNLVKLDA